MGTKKKRTKRNTEVIQLNSDIKNFIIDISDVNCDLSDEDLMLKYSITPEFYLRLKRSKEFAAMARVATDRSIQSARVDFYKMLFHRMREGRGWALRLWAELTGELSRTSKVEHTHKVEGTIKHSIDRIQGMSDAELEAEAENLAYLKTLPEVEDTQFEEIQVEEVDDAGDG